MPLIQVYLRDDEYKKLLEYAESLNVTTMKAARLLIEEGLRERKLAKVV
jgi:hypothetical protein